MPGLESPSRNALALLRQAREGQRGAGAAAAENPPPAPLGPPRFLGLAAEAAGGPEQEALRRVFTRLANEGQGLAEGEQRLLARRLVAAEAGQLPRARREALEQEVLQSLGGRLGLLQPLLDDPEVTEVMVNAPDEVYVERSGRLERASISFRDDRSVQALVERIVAPLGRSFSLAHPLVDARLPDGSRVHAVRPPVALLGTALTIRRFPRAFTLQELVAAGLCGEAPWQLPSLEGPWPRAAPPWVALAWSVRHRANILVSGGTSSGKTTLLNALTAFIPEGERVVVIEDAAELQPQLPHVVRLEARPSNAEGTGAVTIQQLVVNALRMRPDRIVVGEVRDLEALDMMLAMNTGHDGSLSTIHANSPAEVFPRLVQATTLRSSGAIGGASRRAVLEVAASALKLIVQVVRGPGGRRRVDAVVAVEGMGPGEMPLLRPLYRWEGEHLVPTGEVPAWADALAAR
jgi:pilus assembly protein CpaF